MTDKAMNRIADNDLLLAIPTDVAWNILTKWLGLKELASIDCAFCNKSKRQQLHNTLFSSPQCVLSENPLLEFADTIDKLLHWIYLRDIRMERISINAGFNIMTYKLHLRKLGKHVKFVELRDFHDAEDNCFTRAVELLAKCCPNLKSIVIRDCEVSTSVVELLNACTALDELHIYSCIDQKLSKTQVRKLKQLNKMRLSRLTIDCRVYGESTWLQQALMNNLCPTTMQRFCMEGCFRDFETDFLYELILTFANLTTLGLSESWWLTDDNLIAIVEACPHIVHLDISECSELSNTGILAAVQALPLKMLGVQYSQATDDILYALAELRADSLECLLTNGCVHMTGEGFNTVLRQCHKLHTICLGSSDVAVRQVDVALCHRIRALSLYLEDDPSAVSLFAAITTHCKALRHLHIGCFCLEGVVPDVLLHFDHTLLVAEHLPFLQTLVVCRVPNPFTQDAGDDDVDRVEQIMAKLSDLDKLRPCLTIIDTNEADGMEYDVVEGCFKSLACVRRKTM